MSGRQSSAVDQAADSLRWFEAWRARNEPDGTPFIQQSPSATEQAPQSAQSRPGARGKGLQHDEARRSARHVASKAGAAAPRAPRV